MQFDGVYYEADALSYPLGKQLQEQYQHLPWHVIQSHNKIEEFISQPNSEFARLKRKLIIGLRKTHKYTENQKISDYLVPYTSSGCSAMCLYCYLVCNYNKCSYLRLFVNREQMLKRLVKKSLEAPLPQVFEIGSNSDLILENTITGNLEWTIPQFAKEGRGQLTFPTKFDMVASLLPLEHQGKVIFRMSVNPQEIITRVELGTSPLQQRIEAVNQMCEAGYPVGILVAPVILLDGWQTMYDRMFDQLADGLSTKAKKHLSIEIIFMTYSSVHRFINAEAFPNGVQLFNPDLMRGRARGKYGYNSTATAEGELFLREQIGRKLETAHIIYVC